SEEPEQAPPFLDFVPEPVYPKFMPPEDESRYDLAKIQGTIYFPSLPSSTPPSRTPPLLPIPLTTSSPPLLLPSTSHRADVPEATLPPRKRLCIALGFREDYGFVSTLDDEIRHDPQRDGALATDETELEQRMTDFVTTIRRDTDEIYRRLDDAQYDRVYYIFLRLKKMAPKRTTRSTPATTTTTTNTMIDAQLKALIDQGVANSLAARNADRSQNGEDIMTLEWVRGDKILMFMSALTKTSRNANPYI
nr:hypothetical protein [Tanacetum cinerariifolium]